MVALHLDRIWLSSLLDRTDKKAFRGTLVLTGSTSVSTAPYAGGVFRVKRTPGRRRSATVTLLWVDDAHQAWLEAHAGVPLCFRGPQRGLKFWGVYGGDIDFTPRLIAGRWSMSFKVDGFTYSDVA